MCPRYEGKPTGGFRQLSDEAPLRLGQPATGRERRVCRLRPPHRARLQPSSRGGGVEALALLVGLAEETDAVTAEAVRGLRVHGYSWAEIGARLGITSQAAQQRWGAPS